MLEYFITSGAKRKILIYLLNHPDEEYHLRELSRKTGEPAPMIKRERKKEIGHTKPSRFITQTVLAEN